MSPPLSSMDFFGAQDKAKGLSARLVLLFIVGILTTCIAVYFVIVSTVNFSGVSGESTGKVQWWVPEIFLYSFLGALAVIGGSSLFKVASLSGGGAAVAEMMGGRRIDLNSDRRTVAREQAPSGGGMSEFDPQLERRLLNIVEEMALASGTPTPEIYILPEKGINAFAAGTKIENAVIAVTEGALEQLDRDELQGVVAHEFSHILNRDMKLNIQLMGLVFGLLSLTVLGRVLLHSGFASHRGSGGNQKSNPLPIIGLGLILIGAIGAFFGRWIQAAVSRQREFLADSSAVQFTRNPAGIAGALKKIGGYSKGSALDHPETEEISHMLFGNGNAKAFLFATHPPLEERIRRIDGSFDPAEFEAAEASASGRHAEQASGFAGAAANQDSVTLDSERFTQSIGAPNAAHLKFADHLLTDLPEAIRDASHTPFGACAIVYALLLDDAEEQAQSQLSYIDKVDAKGLSAECRRLRPMIDALGPRARLPILDLCVPALRQLDRAQNRRFHETTRSLIESDGAIDLFEYALTKILGHAAPLTTGSANRRAHRHHAISSLRSHLQVLLSGLAHIGADFDAGQASAAYARGFKELGLDAPEFLSDFSQCNLNAIDSSIDEIDGATSPVKRRIIAAMAQVVAHDGKVTVKEGELLRALCDTIGCPVPPLL